MSKIGFLFYGCNCQLWFTFERFLILTLLACLHTFLLVYLLVTYLLSTYFGNDVVLTFLNHVYVHCVEPTYRSCIFLL